MGQNTGWWVGGWVCDKSGNREMAKKFLWLFRQETRVDQTMGLPATEKWDGPLWIALGAKPSRWVSLTGHMGYQSLHIRGGGTP